MVVGYGKIIIVLKFDKTRCNNCVKLDFLRLFTKIIENYWWNWRLPSNQNTPSTHLRSKEQPKRHYYTDQKNHGMGTILGGGGADPIFTQRFRNHYIFFLRYLKYLLSKRSQFQKKNPMNILFEMLCLWGLSLKVFPYRR